jgi:hypothetical protein
MGLNEAHAALQGLHQPGKLVRHATGEPSQALEPPRPSLPRLSGGRLGAEALIHGARNLTERRFRNCHIGQVTERSGIARRPATWLGVNGTERAKNVPLPRRERHSEIGNDAEVSDGQVIGHERVLGGILHQQRCSRCDDMLAEEVEE